jgi:hypothetical protein
MAAFLAPVQRWLVSSAGLNAEEAAAFEIIMQPVSLVLLFLFVVTHVSSVPWALAARALAKGAGDPDKVRARRRLWIVLSGGSTALVVLAGIVGWAVIFTR